jgi:hypothetical protein
MQRWSLAAGFLGAMLWIAPCRSQEEGFVSIFDGKSLAGWQGQDMSFWSIEDGAITGTIRPDHRPPMNQYLVWQGGLVEDFELKLDYRHTGSTTPDTNGGFQYRSRRLPNGDVAGYQVDNNFGQPWRARLYDEFGRHDLAFEGEEARFSSAGIRSAQRAPFASQLPVFRLDDWHEYHLSAIGNELVLRVNGRVIAVAHDEDADSAEARGILAMQLHTGPTMKAQFKNLRLKNLRRVEPDTREALIARGSLHWDLGERANAHQPPLEAVGSVKILQVADRRFAQLHDGSFHAKVDLNTPRAWNVPGSSLTVRVRGSIHPDAPTSYLFAKGLSDEKLHFRWKVEVLEGRRQSVFSLRTDQGLFTVAGPTGMDGAIHEWLARYDGQFLELWTDGQRVAQVPARGNLLPNEAPILIGTASDTDQPGPPFRGELDELTLWNDAISDQEIARLPR